MCANILVTLPNSPSYPYKTPPPPTSTVIDVLDLATTAVYTTATIQLLNNLNAPATLLSSAPSSWPASGPTGIWQDMKYNLRVPPPVPPPGSNSTLLGGPITLNFVFADSNIRPLGICFRRLVGGTGTAAGNMPLKTVTVFAPGMNTGLQQPQNPPPGYIPLTGPSIQVSDTDASQGIGWEYYLVFQVVYGWDDPSNPNPYGANVAALGIIDPGVENDLE